MELLTWTDEDVKRIAEENGIAMDKTEVLKAAEIAYAELNNYDAINEMIAEVILDAIKEAKYAED